MSKSTEVGYNENIYIGYLYTWGRTHQHVVVVVALMVKKKILLYENPYSMNMVCECYEFPSSFFIIHCIDIDLLTYKYIWTIIIVIFFIIEYRKRIILLFTVIWAPLRLCFIMCAWVWNNMNLEWNVTYCVH